MKPIEMRAEVLENFDSLTSKELLSVPTIDVEKDTFSFGTITVNEKVTIPVKITNKGKRNLIIRKVESDCTCTAAIIGNRIVGINDSVILKIVFRPMGRDVYKRQHLLRTKWFMSLLQMQQIHGSIFLLLKGTLLT